MDLEEEIEQAFRDWWDAPSDYDGGISDYMLPLVRKAQAEALREAAQALRPGIRGSACNEGCHKADRITLEMRADRIVREAGL